MKEDKEKKNLKTKCNQNTKPLAETKIHSANKSISIIKTLLFSKREKAYERVREKTHE